MEMKAECPNGLRKLLLESSNTSSSGEKVKLDEKTGLLMHVAQHH